jgi:hypothetical protein
MVVLICFLSVSSHCAFNHAATSQDFLYMFIKSSILALIQSNSDNVNDVLGVAFAISSRLLIHGNNFFANISAFSSFHIVLVRSSNIDNPALVATGEYTWLLDHANILSFNALLCVEYVIKSSIIFDLLPTNHLSIHHLGSLVHSDQISIHSSNSCLFRSVYLLGFMIPLDHSFDDIALAPACTHAVTTGTAAHIHAHNNNSFLVGALPSHHTA